MQKTGTTHKTEYENPAPGAALFASPANGPWAGGAHLVLLPTEGCNLRCVYCYQGHQPVTMSSAMQASVRRLIELLVLEREVPRLHIEWYGGEPLAAWSIVEAISTFAHDLTEDRGVDFTMSMTTNATLLTPQRFERLTELGCADYQITIDGPPEEHDQRRITAGGRGSFTKVWAALIVMKASHAAFRTVVRLGFDRANREAIRRWLPELARHFAGDDRFQFYARPISYPTGSDLTCSPEESGRFAADLRARLAGSGLNVVDMAKESRPGGLGCHAGRSNTVMIGPDGTLHKCAVGLETAQNNLGVLRRDGRLEVDLPLWTRWVSAKRPCSVAVGGPASPADACPMGPELACPMTPRGVKASSAACPMAPPA